MTTAFASLQEPSAEFIGLVVLVLILVSRWLWDYSRHEREQTQLHEPRANPPLHKEYVSKADHDQFRKETVEELKRHAGRRAEIYEAQKQQGEKLVRLETMVAQQGEDLSALKEQTKELQERITSVPQRTIDLLLDAQRLTAKKS